MFQRIFYLQAVPFFIQYQNDFCAGLQWKFAEEIMNGPFELNECVGYLF